MLYIAIASGGMTMADTCHTTGADMDDYIEGDARYCCPPKMGMPTSGPCEVAPLALETPGRPGKGPRVRRSGTALANNLKLAKRLATAPNFVDAASIDAVRTMSPQNAIIT
jgi:hypothetical protein